MIPQQRRGNPYLNLFMLLNVDKIQACQSLCPDREGSSPTPRWGQ